MSAGNPFRYQGPVHPSALIDRRRELDILQRAAADRVAIRLAAPRRYGKTSLLDAHVEAMRAAGHRAVRVDFSKVASVGDATARVAEAFRVLPADPHRTVGRWTARLGISVGGLSLQPAPRPLRGESEETRRALLELLDVPRVLHEGDRELTVVCLDEFQDLLVADDALDGLVRSVIQHHGDAAAYVYAGSQPSLMRTLFADRERPFYGQARPLELPGLPAAEAAQDVEALLEAGGIRAGAAVHELLAFSAGHPQRTMLLAHHLYDLLDRGEAGDDPAREALHLALAETRDAHQAVWDGLGRVERLVLLAVADRRAPTGTRVAAEHRVARSTLQHAVDRLLGDEQHLRRRAEGGVELVDPLLAEWLRRR
ncbi:MAG TPA: hypothetical protein VGV40_02485 [Solirubrobacteraceae bacterium]|nr:hypothetical protein [Solirubrobacteraceae bacterium]